MIGISTDCTNKTNGRELVDYVRVDTGKFDKLIYFSREVDEFLEKFTIEEIK